jgi:hypothetical protein
VLAAKRATYRWEWLRPAGQATYTRFPAPDSRAGRAILRRIAHQYGDMQHVERCNRVFLAGGLRGAGGDATLLENLPDCQNSEVGSRISLRYLMSFNSFNCEESVLFFWECLRILSLICVQDDMQACIQTSESVELGHCFLVAFMIRRDCSQKSGNPDCESPMHLTTNGYPNGQSS